MSGVSSVRQTLVAAVGPESGVWQAAENAFRPPNRASCPLPLLELWPAYLWMPQEVRKAILGTRGWGRNGVFQQAPRCRGCPVAWLPGCL